jgi:AraC-like DNA-binding protein
MALQHILRDSILPDIQQYGTSRVLLAQKSLRGEVLPVGMKVIATPQPENSVRNRRRHVALLAEQWPQQRLISLRFPYLCYILEGTAHIAVGDCVVECPRGYWLIIPPGTPITDGSTPHWYPQGKAGYSDILWLLLRPFGMEYHLCHTRDDQHLGGGFGERGFIADSHLFVFAEMLIDEIGSNQKWHSELSRNCLFALAAMLQRHLEKIASQPQLEAESVAVVMDDELSAARQTVTRAREYIRDNLGKELSLQEIARASYVSRAHLAKLFRSEMKMTVWEYVTRLRVEEAKLLLTETDLSIYDIGRLLGYSGVAYFSSRFNQATGCSPSLYREAQKANQASQRNSRSRAK